MKGDIYLKSPSKNTSLHMIGDCKPMTSLSKWSTNTGSCGLISAIRPCIMYTIFFVTKLSLSSTSMPTLQTDWKHSLHSWVPALVYDNNRCKPISSNFLPWDFSMIIINVNRTRSWDPTSFRKADRPHYQKWLGFQMFMSLECIVNI